MTGKDFVKIYNDTNDIHNINTLLFGKDLCGSNNVAREQN